MSEKVTIVKAVEIDDLIRRVSDWQAGNYRDEEILEALAELKQLRANYQELLYGVSNKYPGETRHQTALRYILFAERPLPEAECAKENKR